MYFSLTKFIYRGGGGGKPHRPHCTLLSMVPLTATTCLEKTSPNTSTLLEKQKSDGSRNAVMGKQQQQKNSLKAEIPKPLNLKGLKIGFSGSFCYVFMCSRIRSSVVAVGCIFYFEFQT